jgi:hypothetical protein
MVDEVALEQVLVSVYRVFPLLTIIQPLLHSHVSPPVLRCVITLIRQHSITTSPCFNWDLHVRTALGCLQRQEPGLALVFGSILLTPLTCSVTTLMPVYFFQVCELQGAHESRSAGSPEFAVSSSHHYERLHADLSDNVQIFNLGRRRPVVS